MDFTSFLDIRRTPWGSPEQGQELTVFSFWIASNIIQPNLQALKDSLPVQEYLINGNCTLHPTKLTQSLTKTLCFFEGKDPRHTYRDDLAARFSQHLSTLSGRNIPIQVVTLNASADDYKTRLIAAIIGVKDFQPVTKLIEADTTWQGPSLILPKWKRQNKESFKIRLQQHDILVSQSCGTKIVGLEDFTIKLLRETIPKHEISSVVIDIPTAAHTPKTGAIYIQHLQSHRDQVKQFAQEFITHHGPNKLKFPESQDQLKHPHGPTLATPIRFQNMSTVTSQQSAPADIPTSKFSTIMESYAPTEIPPKKDPPIPRCIDINAKQFSTDIAASTLASTPAPGGDTSTNTQREQQLLDENQQLKTTVSALTEIVQQLKERMQAMELKIYNTPTPERPSSKRQKSNEQQEQSDEPK